MRVNLLFMSPIILKYLPFCASQLPVSLQCDKRLLAPSLNPFLLRPISSSHLLQEQTSYKTSSLCSNPAASISFSVSLSLLQEVVYSGWFLWESYEHLTRCLWHFSIFYSRACLCVYVCVYELLYVWLLSSKRNNTSVYFCTLYVCVVPSEGVCSVCV